jgi:hypothetical protein
MCTEKEDDNRYARFSTEQKIQQRLPWKDSSLPEPISQKRPTALDSTLPSKRNLTEEFKSVEPNMLDSK